MQLIRTNIVLVWIFPSMDETMCWQMWGSREYFVALVWVLICIFRLPASLNLFIHTWHWCGFSPLWVLVWIVRFPAWLNMVFHQCGYGEAWTSVRTERILYSRCQMWMVLHIIYPLPLCDVQNVVIIIIEISFGFFFSMLIISWKGGSLYLEKNYLYLVISTIYFIFTQLKWSLIYVTIY